jgi:hypothetical protein
MDHKEIGCGADLIDLPMVYMGEDVSEQGAEGNIWTEEE